jgi:hypothetical protein
MFGKKSKIVSRTTKKELKEFIGKDFESRLEKNLKIKKIKNARCADWRVRNKLGLIKRGRRQSHWTGAGAAPSKQRG